MDDGVQMILSICRRVPSIMFLTQIKTQEYRKVSKVYYKGNEANTVELQWLEH